MAETFDTALSRDLDWVLWRLEQPDTDQVDRALLTALKAILEDRIPDAN